MLSSEHKKRDQCIMKIYGNFQAGQPTFKQEETLLRDKIPPLSPLVGYEKDRQKLIEEFFVQKDKNRLFSITGCTGVGKSSLAR